MKLTQQKREVVSFHPDRFPSVIHWAAAQVLIYGGTNEEGDAAARISSGCWQWGGLADAGDG